MLGMTVMAVELITVVISAASAIVVSGVTAIVTARLARSSEREKWERQYRADEEKWERERKHEAAARQTQLAMSRASARANKLPEAEAITLSSAIAYFVINRPNEPRDRIFIAPGDRMFGGRDAELSQILLQTVMASKRHFVIEATGQSVVVMDISSTNGTFVNGARVKRRTELHDGDVVTVGTDESTSLVFHMLR
jgi:pSer/pThr/pTyr-binding forkhead associated (FHA) protein